MNYWLMKSEPGTYSWDDLLKDGSTFWDGVRNYTARNNMKSMKVGDLAFFYHSVKQTRILGVAKIVKEYYQDPSTDDDRWVAVDIEPLSALNNPVTLEQVKSDDRLSDMILVRQSRLSVQPVTKEEWDIIMKLGS